MANKNKLPVIVVGGGLAGLCCARTLAAANQSVLVLEAEGAVGGRVRSDVHDGFTLDRGFQVLQTAYPEAQRFLDYEALDLVSFEPGSLVFDGKTFVRLSDPWRRPAQALSALTSSIGTLSDRWKLAQLRHHVTATSLPVLLAERDMTTAEYLLQHWQFSPELVERFFRPWFSGVFLEPELATSANYFKFLFRMFAVGDVVLPRRGMEAIPQQLAAGLAADSVRCQSRVTAVTADSVTLASGQRLSAAAVVLATPAAVAAQLSGQPSSPVKMLGTTSVYFAAQTAPIAGRYLVLNGQRSGLVNSLIVPSNLVPSVAPAGQSLVHTAIVGVPELPAEELVEAVRRQMESWFGPSVRQWRHLKTVTIPQALPFVAPGDFGWEEPSTQPRPGVFVCGDYRHSGSIQGAMVSGRAAAEAVLETVRPSTIGLKL